MQALRGDIDTIKAELDNFESAYNESVVSFGEKGKEVV